MQFNEKLQQLRKSKNMTQEELSEVLFVSRTAVSKWESGRGLPNIDSIKMIADYFSITVDELLSSRDVLTIATEEKVNKSLNFKTIAFGIIDCFTILFLFLPLFAERVDGYIYSVPLISATQILVYVKVIYYVFIGLISTFGVLCLSLITYKNKLWNKIKFYLSILLSIAFTLFFIVTTEQYAAVLAMSGLIIKGFIMIKKM